MHFLANPLQKKLLHTNKKKAGKKDRVKYLNSTSQKAVSMLSINMKGCSILLAIREMQIKAKMRYYYIPMRMVEMRKVDK